ncbi:MAG: succinate dehydrogenase cytochrome b subunit [Dysgonamonadaceae bacterium]|nr:succinate dehydrogenase cytochrome b subunit [Dysgonamonadaceae bacterium]MDD3357046.1 succinate dehydrogenase cytochrome b subunit [Dysgonamonadaceae bacterium]MDD3726862.1 succinate dehydrogenase cytochrome b subunit [Dysgonamonadaceae bacterium]MDD4246600.1 succinate dehydrogenase cytochrome b subunit [Dysgonamonadaceae bacterium]MDD4605870.1 succinate dehydrogenase cytochrome b subunit [Dysgonamonadaceae bacterium]
MHWLINSTIGRKFVMSISGLFLILFLLFHMSMNLVLVFSLDAYDQVTQFLGANWYAVVASLILAAGFIVHILYASILTLQNQKARGKDKYAVKNTKDASWSSKNMYVLGFVVLSFLVLHMIQFWYEMQFKELFGMEGAINRGSELIVPLFKQPLYVIVYLIAFVALWLHLTHGFWSALHTVGWNNTIWMKRLKNISYVVATIIVAGFTVIPIYVYFFVPSPF